MLILKYDGARQLVKYILIYTPAGLKFSLMKNKEFLEYCYQPLYVPPTINSDFNTSFCFPEDMIVKFLQKLHNTTFE